MRKLLVLWVVMCLVSGCATLPSPATRLPAASTAVDTTAALLVTLGKEPPKSALPRLVALERQASIEKNLSLLTYLWAEQSRIVDGRGTREPDDDYIWVGRAAILDRYVVAVFANPPPPLTKLDDFQIEVTGDSATARHGEDDWRFVKQDGRWWLVELHYSMP